MPDLSYSLFFVSIKITCTGPHFLSHILYFQPKKYPWYILIISTLVYLPSKVANYQFGSPDSELEVTGQNKDNQGKIFQMTTEARNTGQPGREPRDMAGTDGSSPLPRDSDGR